MSENKVTEVPEFVGNRPRSKTFDLQDPVRFGGKVYTGLTVVRMNARQVADWVSRVQAGDKDAQMGNVLDQDGQVVPREVLDGMDDDDSFELDKVLADFLPRRLSALSDSESGTQT